MIGIAIGLLQLLIGVIVICAVIYFVFWVLGQVMGIAIPQRRAADGLADRADLSC